MQERKQCSTVGSEAGAVGDEHSNLVSQRSKLGGIQASNVPGLQDQVKCRLMYFLSLISVCDYGEKRSVVLYL